MTMKLQNKLINLILILILLSSCKKEAESPNLNFTFTNTDTVAPTIITAKNNTTNFSGAYKWQIIKPPFYDTIYIASENLELEANRFGTYKITLTAGEEDLTKSIEITKPSQIHYNKITLLSVGNNYQSLYFKIKEIISSPTTSNYIYTSPLRHNITSVSVNNGNEYWNLSIPIYRTISDDLYSAPIHIFEFYDENNNLVAKTDGIAAWYDEFSIYKDEDEILNTSSYCNNCDYIRISVNKRFTNY